MDSFLKKYKLVDTLSLTLNCDKATFINKFKENVEQSDLSISDSMFEAFTSNSYIYKGNLTGTSFKLRKKQKLFTRNNYIIGNGKITDLDKQTKIDIDINSFAKKIKIGFIIGSIFYFVVFCFIIVLAITQTGFPAFAIVAPIFHGIIIFGMIFFVIKSSVKNFKQEIEREFHFWLR